MIQTPPQPHTLEEDLDKIIDLMRRSDAVRIRRQFRAYSKPSEDIQVGDLCYAAVLPAVGNSRKLMLDWSGPVKVIEIINNAQLKVIETNVNKPRTYIAHRSKLRLCKKMGEKDVHPIFRLPRLPREVMLQLEDELSAIELPCLVDNDVMDEFHVDPVHHGAQRQDDNSSLDSTKTESSNKTSTVKNVSEEEQEQESEDEEQESEDDDEQFQSFCDQPDNIKHSFELPGTAEDKRLSSAASEASGASSEAELRIEAEPEKNGLISAEQNETGNTEGLSSTASEASGASSEAELRIEAEPEKDTLMITEQDKAGTITRRRSERVKTPVDRFDPSPATPRKSKKPGTPRKTTARSRPSLPTTLRETGSRILSSIINEAWEQRPLGPPRQPRSVSRTSTRTRAASLEKMQRTGSIKINQSIITKSVSRVEDRRSRSESRSESRSRSRAGSRDRWGNGLWTDNEDDNQDRDKGGIHVMREKSTLVAKIKDTMTLQPRTGKWIPVNCKLDSKSNNNFLYPIIFNSFMRAIFL